MLCIALLLASAFGPPATPSVAVVDVVVDAPQAEAWAHKLGGRVGGGLEAGGMATSAVDPACTELACALKAARASGSAFVVLTTVLAEGRDYTITLALHDSATGDRVVGLTETCDTCGFAELGATLETVAARATGALRSEEATPATLDVTGSPPHARVTVDGTFVGRTPVQVTVEPGDHELVIEASGHVEHRRKLSVVSGQLASIDVALPLRPSPRGAVAAGASAIAVGVGGLAAGATLLALHARPVTRRCTADTTDADGDCKYLRDTQVGGAVVTTLGAVLVAGGVALLVWTSSKRTHKRRSIARLRPVPMGVSVQF